MTVASTRWLCAAALGLSMQGMPGMLGALAGVGVIACGSRGPVLEEPAEDTHQLPPAPDTCVTGFDCDVVDACCRCDQGGKRIAIRKDAIAEFMVEREQRCAGVNCPLATSNDPSCRAELVCGNYGRCRLVPVRPF
jgi:hypothetical protein